MQNTTEVGMDKTTENWLKRLEKWFTVKPIAWLMGAIVGMTFIMTLIALIGLEVLPLPLKSLPILIPLGTLFFVVSTARLTNKLFEGFSETQYEKMSLPGFGVAIMGGLGLGGVIALFGPDVILGFARPSTPEFLLIFATANLIIDLIGFSAICFYYRSQAPTLVKGMTTELTAATAFTNTAKSFEENTTHAHKAALLPSSNIIPQPVAQELSPIPLAFPLTPVTPSPSAPIAPHTMRLVDAWPPFSQPPVPSAPSANVTPPTSSADGYQSHGTFGKGGAFPLDSMATDYGKETEFQP